MNYLLKVKNAYISAHPAAKASLWYTVCSILQKGMALLSTPVFTRLMSTEQYGIYTVYQSWISMIGIFATLNLYCSVYNNCLTKYPYDRDSVTSSMQGLGSTITFIFVIIYFLNTKFWNKLLGLPTILVIAMLSQLMFEPALNFWMARQRYDFKYKGVVAVTIGSTLISTALGIILVLIGNEKGILRILAYSVVQTFVGGVLYLYNLYKGKQFFSGLYWTFSLKFNIPLIPHYLSYSILSQADRIMINNMVGGSQAAMYSVAYSISMMMQIVTNAISNSLNPYSYQAIKNNELENLKKTTNILLFVIGTGCVTVMLFVPEILKIFASPEYMDAMYVMPPVVASTFFIFLYPLFSTIEFYFEKTKFVMLASSCGAIVNIVLNYIFIPIYGYYAAGFTTLVCYILFSVAHYFFYKQVLKKEFGEKGAIYSGKIILIVSVFVLCFTIISMCIYEFTIIRYLLILVIGLTMYNKRKSIYRQLKILRR